MVRSPWTNEYDPPLEDGVLPTAQLRSMEVVANDIFNGYREMYYEGGAVSVYFWDLDDNAFAACVLFKKGARPLPPLPSPLPPSPSPPLGLSPTRARPRTLVAMSFGVHARPQTWRRRSRGSTLATGTRST